MDSGGYFTDLTTNGFGILAQFQNPPSAHEAVAQGVVQVIGKENQIRTKNFTVEEDGQLVKAWLDKKLFMHHRIHLQNPSLHTLTCRKEGKKIL